MVEDTFMARRCGELEEWLNKAIIRIKSNPVVELHAKNIQDYTNTVQQTLQKDLHMFRTFTPRPFEDFLIFERNMDDAIQAQWYHIWNYPPRLFSGRERVELRQNARALLQAEMNPKQNVFLAIDELVEFCTLLQNPDNWVRVASGQYVQKERPLRTIADMTNEMEQELVSLPRFTAYAKLIEEQGGE